MDHNDSVWVDRRLQSLEPPARWEPDSNGALLKFQRMRKEAARARSLRIWWSFAAAAACLAVVAIWPRAIPRPLHRPGVALEANFREAGSSGAPLLAEIYSDYQCSPCSSLFMETVPRLMKDYVRTGKLRLVHRDLPLPQHPYARLAARYANAAGRIGRYEVASRDLFRTQARWSADGDVDARLAETLPPAEMERVREAVRTSADLDASIDSDIERARADDIRQTPAIVVVANGKRHALAPVPPYPELKSYLDALMREACREDPRASRC